jgi:hypothetical protein
MLCYWLSYTTRLLHFIKTEVRLLMMMMMIRTWYEPGAGGSVLMVGAFVALCVRAGIAR